MRLSVLVGVDAHSSWHVLGTGWSSPSYGWAARGVPGVTSVRTRLRRLIGYCAVWLIADTRGGRFGLYRCMA